VNGDSTSVWYYSKVGAPAGQQMGPVSWEQLLSLAQTGVLNSADMVWNPQLPQWVPASQVPGLVPAAAFAVQQGAYPAGAEPGGQWQAPAPPAAYYPPYQGQYGAPKKGGVSRLAWVIPLVVLVLAAAGLGLYFGLRGDDGDTGGSTGSTKRTTTTAKETGTTEEVITTVTVAPTTTTSPPAPAFWTNLNPGGVSPVARTGQAMVYDPVSQRVLLFGGWSVAEIYNDTWSYDPLGNNWTQLSPAGDLPAARAHHAMAYDPKMGVIVLFGGWDSLNDTELNDTWAYSLSANTWTNLSPTGDLPAPREGHSLVYDPYTGSMIMFGGWDPDSEFSDTWAYSLSANTWTNLSPASDVPSGRDRHSMVYDPTTSKMILFGGWDGDYELDDSWAYDPVANTWTELVPAGNAPSPRSGHRAVYDSVLGSIVLFGGWDGESEFNDTWAYDPATNTWTDVSPADVSPDPRDGHSMVYDEANGRIIIFGGIDGPGDRDLGDTWAYGS
jgi:hypothetical protein